MLTDGIMKATTLVLTSKPPVGATWAHVKTVSSSVEAGTAQSARHDGPARIRQSGHARPPDPDVAAAARFRGSAHRPGA